MKLKRSFLFFSRFLLRILNVLALVCLLLAYLSTLISPLEMSWLSLFGLTYPVWLLVNLFFVVYWFFRKKSFLYLSAVGLLLGLPFLAQFIQLFGQEEVPDGQKQLKVLTYNVRLLDFYNFLGNGDQTRVEILDLVARRQADVMCFQEFYHSDDRDHFPTRDQLLDKNPEWQYHERYTHEMTGKQFFGVITFSKYPIIHRGEIAFQSDDNNFCIYSDIVADQDTFRVFNTHLASIRFAKEDYQFVKEQPEGLDNRLTGAYKISKRLMAASKKRAQQTSKVLEVVKASPYPVIFCGDFNDTPVSYTYEQFDDVLTDSFTISGSGIGRTYLGAFPSFRIDYIWHSSTLSSARYMTLPPKLSDHRAVEVSILYD